MMTWLTILGAMIIVGLVAGRLARGTGIAGAIHRAVETGDPHAIVAAVETAPEREQATHWDQAITSLWQAYQRESAAQVIVAAAQRTDSHMIQFWIRNVIEVEPEIAQAHFSEEFMAEYFLPEIAAQCRKGCCG